MANSQTGKIDHKKHFSIFFNLVFLTALMVAVNYFKLPGYIAIGIIIVLILIQAYLVAGHLMHLILEKNNLVYIVLILTGIFVAGLLLLPAFESKNLFEGAHHVP